MADPIGQKKGQENGQQTPMDPFVIDTLDTRVQLASVPTVYPPRRREPLLEATLLESYSRAFHARLIAAHADWTRLCEMVATESGNALYVEVPSPNSGIGKLWISCEDQRLTVGIGEDFHTHFDTFDPHSDDETVEYALRYIDDFIDERLVLVIATLGNMCCRSWVQRSGETLELPQLFSQSATFRCDHVRSASWRSTYDRHVAIVERPEPAADD